MNFSTLQPYFIPAAVVVFLGWRFLRFRSARIRIPSLLAQGAVIVDVRSREEFLSGSREGSLNIPLGEIEKKADQLDRSKPVILCCASGARSGIAVGILRRKGFQTVLNAGPWKNTL